MRTRNTISSTTGPLDLNCDLSGSGPAVVWGHNLMGSMAVDDVSGLFDFDAIAARHTLLRYDARGHGESQGSYTPEHYRWPVLADDMICLAESQTSDRYILGGVSMGCATALQAALQAPENIAGLILVLPPTGWRSRPRQAKLYRRLARVFKTAGNWPFRLAAKVTRSNHKDRRTRMALGNLKGMGKSRADCMQATLEGAALSDLPTMEQLMEIRVPTAIYAWRGDSSHPEYTAELLSKMMPDVRDFDLCDPADTIHWTQRMLAFTASLQSKAAA